MQVRLGSCKKMQRKNVILDGDDDFVNLKIEHLVQKHHISGLTAATKLLLERTLKGGILSFIERSHRHRFFSEQILVGCPGAHDILHVSSRWCMGHGWPFI